jgi:hypothetical protein
MPQPRIGIGAPFQGFLEWGRVSQGVALGLSWGAPSGLWLQDAPFEAPTARPNFSPGQRPGLHRQTNESPETVRQPMRQPRIGIGTPFQGFLEWGSRFPGRCPGLKLERPFGALVHDAPFEAPIEIGNTQFRSALQAPKGRSNFSPGQRPGERDPIRASPERAFQSPSAAAWVGL